MRKTADDSRAGPSIHDKMYLDFRDISKVEPKRILVVAIAQTFITNHLKVDILKAKHIMTSELSLVPKVKCIVYDYPDELGLSLWLL